MDLIVSKLELRKFHILGYSLGGGVAIQYAAKHPEKIRSMFLISSFGLYDQSLNSNTDPNYDLRYETNADFVNMFNKVGSGVMPFPSWLVGPLRHHKNNTASKEIHVLRGIVTTSSLMDKSVLEKLVDIPAMFVQGSGDVITPIDGLHYFLSHVPLASHHIIEGGSHMITHTHLTEISGFINEWIEKVVTSAT